MVCLFQRRGRRPLAGLCHLLYSYAAAVSIGVLLDHDQLLSGLPFYCFVPYGYIGVPRNPSGLLDVSTRVRIKCSRRGLASRITCLVNGSPPLDLYSDPIAVIHVHRH